MAVIAAPPERGRQAAGEGLSPLPALGCTWDVLSLQLLFQAPDPIVELIICFLCAPELSLQCHLHVWSTALAAQVMENLSSAAHSPVLLQS